VPCETALLCEFLHRKNRRFRRAHPFLPVLDACREVAAVRCVSSRILERPKHGVDDSLRARHSFLRCDED
jgi:hypothetical protein